MRLSKAALQPQSHFLADLEGDFCTDLDAAAALQQRRASSRLATTTAGRVELRTPLDVCNVPGWLELPTSFGSLYLGEAFQSYFSVNNTSKQAVTSVICKVELETARGKAALYDNTSAKVDLQPGSRHDFIVRHDVKEVGQHTLACSVAYTTSDGDRRFLPQYFKFTSANPLSVRTKSRSIGRSILLEACIENTSRAPLVLEYVRFEPAGGVAAQSVAPSLDATSAATVKDARLADYIRELQIISPNGGATNVLYRLELGSQLGSRPPDGPTGVIGKLDIKWRTPMGDGGRLQTLPITASLAAARDFEIQAVDVPDRVPLERAFRVGVRVFARSERRIRDHHLLCKPAGAGASKVLQLGLARVLLQEDSDPSCAKASIEFIALERGVQRLPEIVLTEADSLVPLDTLNLSVRVG